MAAYPTMQQAEVPMCNPPARQTAQMTPSVAANPHPVNISDLEMKTVKHPFIIGAAHVATACFL